MNLSEAQAITDSSNEVFVSDDPGFEKLVCIDNRRGGEDWYDEQQLADRLTQLCNRRRRVLLEAALICLRDRIARCPR